MVRSFTEKNPKTEASNTHTEMQIICETERVRCVDCVCKQRNRNEPHRLAFVTQIIFLLFFPRLPATQENTQKQTRCVL